MGGLYREVVDLCIKVQGFILGDLKLLMLATEIGGVGVNGGMVRHRGEMVVWEQGFWEGEERG